ncbi:hypothetical protein FTO68_01565 [Methanocalculus taiwanensis]|uniref:Hydrogenase n=1 Tax=Methanocalculus taiwanensis TaxID=106207 RepID=A0ABD4TK72_9EURY|nr:hypothetical protein [Methanocalculus taiwanensis]MCQ1537680.1 hypothetical protein [Methanocalculus taiwanensis]
MTLIRYCLLAGILLYTGIFLIQGATTGAVLAASIIGLLILLGIGSTLFISDEKQLRKVEMILIWCCVLAFAVYGILVGGGFV